MLCHTFLHFALPPLLSSQIGSDLFETLHFIILKNFKVHHKVFKLSCYHIFTNIDVFTFRLSLYFSLFDNVTILLLFIYHILVILSSLLLEAKHIAATIFQNENKHQQRKHEDIFRTLRAYEQIMKYV